MDSANTPTTGTPVTNSISDGLFFSTVIQGRSITVQLPPTIIPALSGLPAPSSAFAGRDGDVEDLLAALAPAPERQEGERHEVVLVAAVAGLAGIGKTELVVQTAARALAEPGWFPGGALFTDLNGYDTNPQRRLSPHQALDGWLRALAVPPEHIPDQLPNRAALFRTVLAYYAEQGRRILLVVDNAGSEDQARPLLPTDPHTAALVTSRHTLDIGARLHDLPALDTTASVDLLRQVLRQLRGPADTRVADAPEEAMRIAELCAGLPLALRITAALLAEIPAQPLASMADALRDERTRLDRIRRPGSEQAVRAAFDLSYAHLTPDQARLFRLLPLNAGPHVSTEAAAHLADHEAYSTGELLRDLARAHLIDPAEEAWGRWRLHDLVRLYADERGREQAEADHRAEAATRLLDHYVRTAKAAGTHLDELSSGPPSEPFAERAEAAAWLEAEQVNLVAAATVTARQYDHSAQTDLAFILSRFYRFGRHVDDWITLATAAADIFHRTGDRNGEAKALNNRGLALRVAKRYDEAVTAHTAAANTFREMGDRRNETSALNNLGLDLRDVQRYEQSVTVFTAALDICQQIGTGNGEATALINLNLGIVLHGAQRFDEAVNAFTAAAEIFGRIGEAHREAGALGHLGISLRAVQRYDEALIAHTSAAEIFGSIGADEKEDLALK
ncbi:tetratricopeptide repeat protein [Streptomyces sp. NPDC087270]|uniref:tetratricopeptide repeat protein n=1 Tax=Streptomyces sp. NPDC087270 TaxID=3365774 RepID=UPI0038194C83